MQKIPSFRDTNGRWDVEAEMSFYTEAALVDAAEELGITGEQATQLVTGFFRHRNEYYAAARQLPTGPDGLPL
jgi:hypothetical protein